MSISETKIPGTKGRYQRSWSISVSYLGCASIALLASALTILGCAESLTSQAFNASVSARRYLYVASGACYGGGVTLSTGSATVVKYDLQNGAFSSSIVDYNSFALNDQPVGIQFFPGDKLLIGIENAGGRRIDVVGRDGSGLTTYLANTTAINTTLRGLTVLLDGSILAAKLTAIEKFSPSRARVTQGANPWVNAPAAPCATSTTAMSNVTTLTNGLIVYTHAAATPNNRIGVISSTGYVAAADCKASLAGPTTTALPTAVVFHSGVNKLLVAYGSTTAASNFIYSYDINASTGALSNATLAYSDAAIINGPSAMTVDPDTGVLYVANATNSFNNVQRFSVASNGTLTLIDSLPFINSTIYSRCISGMLVGN